MGRSNSCPPPVLRREAKGGIKEVPERPKRSMRREGGNCEEEMLEEVAKICYFIAFFQDGQDFLFVSVAISRWPRFLIYLRWPRLCRGRRRAVPVGRTITGKTWGFQFSTPI